MTCRGAAFGDRADETHANANRRKSVAVHRCRRSGAGRQRGEGAAGRAAGRGLVGEGCRVSAAGPHRLYRRSGDRRHPGVGAHQRDRVRAQAGADDPDRDRRGRQAARQDPDHRRSQLCRPGAANPAGRAKYERQDHADAKRGHPFGGRAERRDGREGACGGAALCQR